MLSAFGAGFLEVVQRFVLMLSIGCLWRVYVCLKSETVAVLSFVFIVSLFLLLLAVLLLGSSVMNFLCCLVTEHYLLFVVSSLQSVSVVFCYLASVVCLSSARVVMKEVWVSF